MNRSERMCVFCRNRFDKADLLRFITGDKSLVFDESGKSNGRGAYICRDCIKIDKKRQNLGKILKAEVRDKLWEEIKTYCH